MNECFICLQEVPGDLLPLLNQLLDSHVDEKLQSKPLMHIQNYSRKPKIRERQGGILYNNMNESLVTIHYHPHISSFQLSQDQIRWTPCPSDGGKGALTLTTISGLNIINAHVPYDNKAAMELLHNISWPQNNIPFLFVGDINRYSEKFMKMLDEIIMNKPSLDLLFPITTNKHTRVGFNPNGNRVKVWIDHYAVSASLRHMAVSPATVYDDIGDISDHYPISLLFKSL